MKKKRFNKKSLIAMAFCAILLGVGGTIAINNTVHYFENDFYLSTFQAEVSEKFESPESWKPCDETEKKVTIKNTGNLDMNVRIKLDEMWESANGEQLDLMRETRGGDTISLALINLHDTDAWELREGYYYLKNSLAAGSEVIFMDSVTFNCEADFGENTMVVNGTESSKTEDDYNGAKYKLSITAQMLDANATIAWDEAFAHKDPETFAVMSSSFTSYLRGSIPQGGNVKAFRRSKVNLAEPAAENHYTRIDGGDSVSDYPAYMWYVPSEEAEYWYSAADALTIPGSDYNSLSYWISEWTLTDISGMADFDMKNFTSVAGLFYGSNKANVTNWDSIRYWDLSGVTNLGGVIQSGVTDDMLAAVEDWKFSSNLVSASGLCNSSGVTSLEKLKNWNVSSVTNMSGAFSYCTSLTNLTGLSRWNVGNVTNFSSMFAGMSQLTDLSAIARWNVSSGTVFGGMFAGSGVNDLTQLASWDVGNAVTLGSMFGGCPITDLSPVAGWRPKPTTDISYIFSGTLASDASVLEDWNMSSSANKTSAFSGANFNKYPTWY